MNYFKTTLFIAIISSMIFVSCSKSNDLPVSGTVNLKAKATMNSTAPKALKIGQKSTAQINIESFNINIKKIEFDVKDNDTINEDLVSDMELNGPFELNLTPDGTSASIAVADLPTDTYDKIKFELDKSTDPNSNMYGKSIEITGTIDGTPFVFWSDSEEEVKIDYANASIDIVVDGTTTSKVINFDLSSIFGLASSIDFSMVTDGNQNGVIEINPNNDDGNAELADLIKNLIEEGTDVEDD
ncbi:MAG: DUF4382 domain-containing protein [Lutibacter sp.]